MPASDLKSDADLFFEDISSARKTEEDEEGKKIESPAKEMKDEGMPSARRSSGFIDPANMEETKLIDKLKKSNVKIEYRPLEDVYEVESYKEYNRIQYAEVMR